MRAYVHACMRVVLRACASGLPVDTPFNILPYCGQSFFPPPRLSTSIFFGGGGGLKNVSLFPSVVAVWRRLLRLGRIKAGVFATAAVDARFCLCPTAGEPAPSRTAQRGPFRRELSNFPGRGAIGVAGSWEVTGAEPSRGGQGGFCALGGSGEGGCVWRLPTKGAYVPPAGPVS